MKIHNKTLKIDFHDYINDNGLEFDISIPSLSAVRISDLFTVIRENGILEDFDNKCKEIFTDCCSKCAYYGGCKYLESFKFEPYIFFMGDRYINCNSNKSLFECGILDNDIVHLWSCNLHCDHYVHGWRLYKENDNISKIIVKKSSGKIFELFIELEQYSPLSLLEDLISNNVLDDYDTIRFTTRNTFHNPMYYIKTSNNIYYHHNTNISLKKLGVKDNDVIEIGIAEPSTLTIPPQEHFNIVLNNKKTIWLDIATSHTTPDGLVEMLVKSGIIPPNDRIEDGVHKIYNFSHKNRSITFGLPRKDGLSLNKYGYFDGDILYLNETEYKAESGCEYINIILLNNESIYLPIDIEIATPKMIIEYLIQTNVLLTEYILNGETMKINYAYRDKYGKKCPISCDCNLRQLGFKYFDKFKIETIE